MFRVFNGIEGKKKCVYIAPLKALVRERMIDWKVRLEQKLGKKVVELTGDVTPDMKMVAESDVIVTTPEKWGTHCTSLQESFKINNLIFICFKTVSHVVGRLEITSKM